MNRRLSMAQAAGQVIVAGFGAGPPPPGLLDLADRGCLGGFVLFKRNLPDWQTAADLNRALIGACPDDLPPWIGLDQEGGRVARLGPPVLKLPPMGRLARLGQPALTGRAAAMLGQQLAALGFNLDFAPVLDVDSNPDNPVIGDRSFGPEPELVIAHGRAFAAGLESAGIAACGKHFPGHGDTAEDSHLSLPRLAHDRARLERLELRPFAALKDELPSLMTAHILFNALDPSRPATLSPVVVQGLLREELGYEGVIFSDDLEMKAIADHHGLANAACDAVAAGCDSVLICSQAEATMEAQAAMARRAHVDSDFAERLQDAARRSLSARLRYPAAVGSPQDFSQLAQGPVFERLQEALDNA